MKRIFASIITFILFFNTSTTVFAQQDLVTIEVLGRDDCTHCQDQKAFFQELQQQRTDFEVVYHDIYQQQGLKLWEQLTELEGLAKVTPITYINGTIIEGFGTPETTGIYIEQLIDANKSRPTTSLQEFIDQGGGSQAVTQTEDGTCTEDAPCVVEQPPLVVNAPVIGAIDLQAYSLPTMSIILGFIDGFNPCAMWVLVTFLIVLAQVGSRKKMWIYAGLFILAEAIMYTLILTTWLTAWNFVGLDNVVTPIVGLIAIGGGIFFLYEWKTSKDEIACKVTNLKQRQRTHNRIQQLVSQPLTLLTAFGIIALAFSVNVIEFACSIGIPQAFTKILDLNALSLMESAWYIFLYISFYMIDDLIVFGIALYGFQKIGLASKYSKLSSLIGGILMIALGLLLIFKREWLMF